MKNKRIIARALPVDTTYRLVNVDYAGEGDASFWQCENCGKMIKNLCTVESGTGKRYIIGTECCDRLTGIEPSDTKEAKRILRILKSIRKKIIEKKNDNNFCCLIDYWKNGSTGESGCTIRYMSKKAYENDNVVMGSFAVSGVGGFKSISSIVDYQDIRICRVA